LPEFVTDSFSHTSRPRKPLSLERQYSSWPSMWNLKSYSLNK
jgi:hypothetical protein